MVIIIIVIVIVVIVLSFSFSSSASSSPLQSSSVVSLSASLFPSLPPFSSSDHMNATSASAESVAVPMRYTNLDLTIGAYLHRVMCSQSDQGMRERRAHTLVLRLARAFMRAHACACRVVRRRTACCGTGTRHIRA
eukprot:6191740-Pleurochrysis_carterae.AAC.2